MGHPFGAVGEQLFGAVHAFGVAEDQLFGAVHAFGVAGSQFACFGDYPASFSDRLQCRAGEPFRLILPIGDLGEMLLCLIQAVCIMLGGAHGGFSCGPGPGRVGVAGHFFVSLHYTKTERSFQCDWPVRRLGFRLKGDWFRAILQWLAVSNCNFNTSIREGTRKVAKDFNTLIRSAYLALQNTQAVLRVLSRIDVR